MARPISRSIRRDPRVPDDRAPSFEIIAESLSELRRRAADSFGTLAFKHLTHVGQFKCLREISVKLLDDGERRSRRCEQAEPRHGLETGTPLSAIVGTSGTALDR